MLLLVYINTLVAKVKPNSMSGSWYQNLGITTGTRQKGMITPPLAPPNTVHCTYCAWPTVYSTD